MEQAHFEERRAAAQRLGSPRGGLSQSVWRQLYTSSIRAITTYGWEWRIWALFYRPWKDFENCSEKDHRRIPCSPQDLIENIAKIEPIQVKIRDMKVRDAARIMEKGVQNNLIHSVDETRESVGGRSWKDHSTAWALAKPPHYNTSMEEIWPLWMRAGRGHWSGISLERKSRYMRCTMGSGDKSHTLDSAGVEDKGVGRRVNNGLYRWIWPRRQGREWLLLQPE